MVLLETPAWAALDRIKALGEGDWTKDVVVIPSGDLGISAFDLCDSLIQRQLTDWCKEEDLGILLLDPLSFLHTGDENKAQDAIAIGTSLKQIALESGSAIIALHHERKSAPGGGVGSDLDSGRGSSALAAAVGLYMRLAKKRGAHCLTFPKVQMGKRPDPLYLAPAESGAFEVIDAPENASVRREARVEALRGVLAEGGDWRFAALTARMAELGHQVSDRTWKSYLRQLRESGEMVTGERGVYRIAAPGPRESEDIPF
jgi:hypothetical protein